MKAPLTPEDIKSLRYECRPGILIASGLFFMFFVIILISFDFEEKAGIPDKHLIFTGLLILLLILCLLLAFMITRKYIKDIKNDEKDLTRYPILRKEGRMDYEAGSASLWYTQKMNAWDHYQLTIDNGVHDVDKEMFDHANVGDEVIMHTAPLSGHLLKIELMK